MSKQKMGYVALVGRPNVGKSTLLNALMGKKISITAAKPQTTRHQIIGIKTCNNIQMTFMDTPGIHTAEKRVMSRYLNKLAFSVLPDADVIVWIIDALTFTNEDELVLNKLASCASPIILVINKIDKLNDKKLILPLIEKYKDKLTFQAIIPLSARLKENIDTLYQALCLYMKEGPFLFDETAVTDKPAMFQVAEIIREKLIHATNEEVPYSTAVTIDSVEEKNKLLDINAIIWVEREGQKPIIIGKDGERLKKIGTHARKEIVKLLKRKIFLRLWVKVKSDWTDNDTLMQRLGFLGHYLEK